ncbi:MAG: CHASE domain-containing protein [Calditrichia bacterium]
MTLEKTNNQSISIPDTEHSNSSGAQAVVFSIIHWGVLALALMLTVTAWYFSKEQVNDRTQMRFKRQADQAIELVTERLKKYEDKLWSSVSTIRLYNGKISYKKWHAFANSFRIDEKYPGINGIGVIYHIEPEQLSDFLTKQRLDRPNFTVHPPHDKNEYWPITYIEPEPINLKAVGLDIAFEESRYSAAKKARDSGSTQVTGPIVLVQDKEQTPGFLLFVPFYRREIPETVEERRSQFLGLVYAPFVVKKLMAGFLAKSKRQVAIRISDNGTTLYDEHLATEDDYDEKPLLKKMFLVDLYGRKLLFEIRSTKSFRKATASNQPWLILVSGVFIDMLLILIFVQISRKKDKAVEFSNKINLTLQKQTKALQTEMIKRKEATKRLEDYTEKLARSSEETERFLSSITLVLIGINENDVITRWNPAAEQVFGIQAGEVLGKPITGAPIDWNWVDVLRYISMTHESNCLAKWDDLKFTNRNGEERLLSVTVNPILTNRTEFSGFLMLAEDITEHRQLELQLAQSQRLQSVGQLAAGLAHEINTPIQYIGDNIHFLTDAFEILAKEILQIQYIHANSEGHPEDDNVHFEANFQNPSQMSILLNEIPEAIEASLDGISQVSKIVEAVRGFSHPGSATKSLTNINEALEKAIVVSRNEWKYIADIIVNFDEDLPAIKCFPGELNQVFLNIIVNGSHAIRELAEKDTDLRGKITISTSYTSEYVRIDFRDTGVGIPEAIQNQIFNPFFTTKGIGKGTGQGLALSFSVIVEKHGGSISVESEVGHGALFTIKLPFLVDEV